MTNQEQYELMCEKAKKYDRLVEVLDEIRAEIKRMTPTYHNSDWSIIDLVSISEVLDVVDKYRKEQE